MISKYKCYPLKNFIKQIRGVSYKKDQISEKPIEGYIPLLRATNIQNGELTYENVLYVAPSLVKDEQKLRKYDILIAASSGSKEVVGKPGQVKEESNYTFGAFCKLIRPNTNINPDYLRHFFNTKYYSQTISQSINGANINNLRNEHIDNLMIPVPSIDIQRKIAILLNKAQNLIKYRKAQIEALDQLTQSVFLEMFGDPSTNPKRWKKVNLEEIAIKEKGAIKSGPFGSQLLISEYVKNGIPVLGIDNVEKNKFVWAKPKAISEQKYKELKAFRVYSGDVLISRTGTVGRTCVVPDDFKEGIIGPNLLKVTLDKNLMLPEVLSIMFNYLPHVINQIKWMSPGATVPVFNTKNLKKVKVLVPDKKVQVEFVKKIKEVEELKSKFILGLTDLEKNYNSLMQRAFKGELFTEEKVSNL
ncbi:restriction modification system DNA specificity subunit [Caldibacillus thermoamylovorans]|uniref:Restriction modification system DNA specificity subunit n=1 Tax=Caldibacillus thermoamylovorans TaxID=35841 RepID=A0A090IW56_9BACI|nr:MULTISPECIES: restriction endonuclease subunit S [Bacillaceae]PAC33019.1 hypothetical protein CEJ87_16750 [Caldifermentibacillus hisashii]CEE00683.1 restriction modification system DNA specificity subunit [Caldibacillus thermoamylovorans]